MQRDRVFFTGSTSIAHPVLDKLFGGSPEPARDASRGDFSGSQLVVIDARLDSSDLGEDGTARNALAAGIPVLILSPHEGQLDALARVIGAVPKTPMQALFVAPNSNRDEPTRYEATFLGYPATLTGADSAHGDVEGAKDRGERTSGSAGEGCGCGDGGAQKGGNIALANFTAHIHSRAGKRKYAPAALDVPSGLRFFQTTWPGYSPFTSSGCDDDDDCFSNGQGSVTVSYIVWGFLNQTQTSNSQYLIIQGTYSVYPGSLAGNDDETRGWLNAQFVSSVGPTAGGFSATAHVPTNGTNSWNESFTIPISYVDPVNGGFSVYEFTATVNQSIGSWSVQNASSGTRSGSNWWVNSPVNGSNLSETADDAFSFWGTVEDFPSASTGTLTVSEASAWQTSQIQSGNVTVALALTWVEAVFYGTGCFLGTCAKWNAMWQTRSYSPSFSVSFASITP